MSKRSVEQEPERRVEMVGTYEAPPSPGEPPAEDELRCAERLVVEGERAGLDDLEMGMRLGDVVRICFARQAWAEAVPPLTRLLALNRAQGDDRPEVATVLSSLATARYALGAHNEAAQLWEESLAIRERWLVPNHFMIARSAENLAEARVAQGRMDEALGLLRRALSIWQQTLPPSDPTVRAIRTKIGDLQLLSSQELPGRGPAAPRSSSASPAGAPARAASYAREPMGAHGVQLGLEGRTDSPDLADAHRAPSPRASSADPPGGVTAPAPAVVPESVRASAVSLRRPDEALPPAESELAAAVAPLFIAPAGPRAPSVPSGGPTSSPFLVDLDAPEAELPEAVDLAEPEQVPVARNWLQLGRALAVSAPESSLEFPADMHEEPGVAARRAARVPRAGGAAAVIILIAIFAAYRLAGSDSPVAEASGAAPASRHATSAAAMVPPSASVVRQTSAGTVVPTAGRRATSPARVVPDETETVPRGSARERDASGDETAGRGSRAATTGRGSLKSVPAMSAQLADAMKAVESTTVVGSDSAVRQMLYGRALGLPTEADLATSRPSAPVKAPAEDTRDMKPAMLVPGGTQPVFPFQLLSENAAGTVVIEVLVDATGHVDARRARVVRSDNPLFTAAVLRALPTMRFVPAEAHGQKVAQLLQVPFRFDRTAARP